MKKMLIALLAAASLQATAQTEGNDTSFPNVVTDSVIPMKQALSSLTSDSVLPSIMFRRHADGLKLNQMRCRD